jgi:hypothetical protein
VVGEARHHGEDNLEGNAIEDDVACGQKSPSFALWRQLPKPSKWPCQNPCPWKRQA